jgi:heme A synthase
MWLEACSVHNAAQLGLFVSAMAYIAARSGRRSATTSRAICGMVQDLVVQGEILGVYCV